MRRCRIKASMKEEIFALLRAADWDGLVARAREDRRLLTALIGVLYHPDEFLAWRAVEGFGRLVAVLAADEEFCRDRMRRLFWALNDESGTSGRFVAPAVGEAVARAPDFLGENALILLNALDEPYLQAGVAWAFGRIGGVRPELVREAVPQLRRLLGSPDPQVRGCAAWALGEMDAVEAAAALNELTGDAARVRIYLDGNLTEKTVGELAAGAVAKLKAKTACRSPFSVQG
ncbi:DVU0298 family protein [Thermodesulfitimonas autotrophica]|uniref:DVU0298 family protein n=1 Tax=Thermodesulfitimonas autotrophica TaxID=1894989 RepID=UPI002FDF20E0